MTREDLQKAFGLFSKNTRKTEASFLLLLLMLLLLGCAPSPSPTATATSSPSATNSPTVRPSDTPTASPSATASPTVRPSATASPSQTNTPGSTRTARPSRTPAITPSLFPTEMSIEAVLETHATYEYFLEAGHIIAIEFASEEFQPQLSLQSPDGASSNFEDICENANPCLLIRQLQTTGLYTLNLQGLGSAGGGYILNIHYMSACSDELPIAVVRVTAANLRERTSQNAPSIGQVEMLDCLVILGRNESGNWLFVETSDGQEAWIVARNVQIFDDLLTIPTASP